MIQMTSVPSIFHRLDRFCNNEYISHSPWNARPTGSHFDIAVAATTLSYVFAVLSLLRRKDFIFFYYIVLYSSTIMDT